MCAKVSGFAFLVQARTCGRGQRCNFWWQKTAGQHVYNSSQVRKNVKVGYHSGFLFSFLKTFLKWKFDYIITKQQEILLDFLTRTPHPSTGRQFIRHCSYIPSPSWKRLFEGHTLLLQSWLTPQPRKNTRRFSGTAALKHYLSPHSKCWVWRVCSPQQR